MLSQFCVCIMRGPGLHFWHGREELSHTSHKKQSCQRKIKAMSLATMATTLSGLLARNPVTFSFLRDRGGRQLHLGWTGVKLLLEEEEEEGQVKQKGPKSLMMILKRTIIIWVASRAVQWMTMTLELTTRSNLLFTVIFALQLVPQFP